MKKHLKCLLVSLLFLASTLTIHAQKPWTKLDYSADIAQLENNPLKGLMPGFDSFINSFPYSMEHFYIGLNQVMKVPGQYDWSEFDAILSKIAQKGCHAVPRFYIDYPGRTYALPDFLKDKVAFTNYTDYDNTIDQSKSPNWNSDILIAALEKFIAAFGAKYDGDIRIAAVEIGIYGFWGEWHNYPHDDWDMDAVNKDKIIASFVTAFTKTQLCLREPRHASTQALKNSVGYHDDSFCESTLGKESWYFWPKMIENGTDHTYEHHPNGGEVYPILQKNGLWDYWPNKVGQDIASCIKETHASWMVAHELFSHPISAEQHKNALKMHQLLGYQFYVDSVKLTRTADQKIKADVKISNNGVAPFYYNWRVEFAAVTTQGKWIGKIGSADWQINHIMPTSKNYDRTFTSSQSFPSGSYKILMRFVNPLEASYSHAKILRFANEQQDADKNGWLTLGIVEI